MKLDNAVANQQVEQAKIQLALAEDLYNRRKNLWDKQIGTEVELIQARTNVENLKKVLHSHRNRQICRTYMQAFRELLIL